MQTTARRRDPELRNGVPIWCHHHGARMIVSRFILHENAGGLVIASNSASVTITRWNHTNGVEGLSVCWEVKHCYPETKASGRVLFTPDDLQSAFGLSDRSGIYGAELIERFGADVAEQGKYIRWKDFLNIPCPGTGNDGDPNVSIHLDEKIRSAIYRFV